MTDRSFLRCSRALLVLAALSAIARPAPAVDLDPGDILVVDDVLEIEVPDPEPAQSLREILLAHARAEDISD